MQAATRTGPGGQLIVLAMALALGSAAAAQDETSQRYAEVYGTKIELQENLRQRLEHTLTPIARPFEIYAMVRVQMRTEVQQITEKETREGIDLKLAGSEAVKLPGLPAVRGPAAGAGNPNVTFKLPGESRVQTRQTIAGVVENLSVRLWVEQGLPAEQLELIKQTAIEIAGVDPTRGDSIEILDMPARATDAKVMSGTLVAQRSVLIFSGTLLLCALIVAIGLLAGGRRGKAAAGTVNAYGVAGGNGAGNGHANGASNGTSNGKSLGVAQVELTGAAATGGQGRARHFGFLAEASEPDLIQVLLQLPPRSAAVVLDRVAVSPELVRELLKRLPDSARLVLVEALATPRVLDIDEVKAIEKEARAIYDAVLRKVELGGAGRAADLLAGAAQEDLQAVLSGLAARDASLVEAIRKGMLLFGDLPGMSEDELRQVVSSADPATLVTALQGMEPSARAAVLKPVSRRLRSMLDAEAEVTPPQPPEVIEEARRSVEKIMRAVREASRSGARRVEAS